MSRKDAFVSNLIGMAEDDSHGYSQKPPGGRWGPDYDCSSLIYECAEAAGYHVGRANEDGKVRFTGTMLEDFKKAGFQILPFANVGLGELEVGDILLNLALHAEVYVGEGQVVGAESSEDGGYSGKPGDQTGQEIVKQPVYEYDKGWDYVLRPPSEGEDEEEENEMDSTQEGKGGSEMPYPYTPNYGSMNNPMGAMPWQGAQRGNMGWPQGGYAQGGYNQGGQAYPQGGYNQANQAYPQGNLGQMNGYSQANAGYPQGQQKQLNWVNGMEGARDHHLAPNSCDVMFDQQDPSIMYVKSTDQQGFPSIRVFKTTEISEDMPQHHMPGEMYSGQEIGGMMQTQQPGQFVSRQEFDELKEMIANVQSAIGGSMDGGPQGNSGQQGNGSQGRSNNQQSSNRGNARNS